MSENDASTEVDNLPARVVRHADTAYGLTLRSAIASIPFIGSSVSLLLEARLAAFKEARVEQLYARLVELEQRFAAGPVAGVSRAADPSENLVEVARAAAADTPDQERARVFADILYLEGAGDDRTEVLRRFLLEVMATLTRYELALLLRHAPTPGSSGNNYAEMLLALHAENPEILEVREFSMQRLATFRLIDKSGDEIRLTQVGRHLLSVI